MNVPRLPVIALGLCLAVSGCSSVLTATRDDPIADNRGTRTIGSKIDDSLIEQRLRSISPRPTPTLIRART